MRYLSVCSGIEAASVAWHHLGWSPVAFSEIEPFPAAVLAHHYPNVPNYGDMTKHKEWPLEPGSIDLLVGGTPCQSFSVAGLRKGLHDPRGGLMLTYLEIAQRLRPRWVVWENVPGVLSSGGGRDFGSFLGALGELGYGWAYRVLDAQWVRTQRHPRAVPQRRRRVFVVGCLVERGAGDRNPAAAVLFERESVCRDSAPRRAKGQGVAADAEAGAGAGCWPARVSCTLNHAFGTKLGLEDQHALHGAPMFVPSVVGALTAKGPEALTKQNANGGQRMPDKDNFGAVLQPVASTLGNRGLRSHTELDGHGAYIPQPVAIQGNLIGREQGGPQGVGASDDGVMYTLTKADVHGVSQPVPYDLFQITAPVNRQNRQPGDPCHTLARDNAAHAAVAFDWQSGGDSRGLDPKDTAQLQRCQTPAVAFTRCDNGGDASVEVTPTMRCGSNYSAHPAVAFTDAGQGQRIRTVDESSETLRATKRGPFSDYYQAMTVRRLTPRECERLQGFPDDWTLIPWRKKPADECPDGPRYKALGNSMAVNCMAWIGERIAAVEARHDR